MIKLKLKRKISGKKIRADKRQKEFHPTETQTVTFSDGTSHTYIHKKNMKYENKGLYEKNRIKKRHVENPNIYEGEKPLNCSLKNIRVPSKKRKTAMKRFKKAFPYIKVDKQNKPHFKPESNGS